MTICPHTGITVPECSCEACIRRLIEQHMPASRLTAEIEPVASEAATASPDLIPATPITDAPGRRRLRRFRRSRLRRSA